MKDSPTYLQTHSDLLFLAPSYASVFGGTLFESTYMTAAADDFNFLQPAVVWTLLWKHSGLRLGAGTILLRSLKSYYNLVILGPSGDTASLALGT